MTGTLLPIRKILVLRGGALGDFILTLPALAALRRRCPQAAIELRTRPRHVWLALESGLADTAADIDDAGMAEFFMPAPGANEPWPPIYEDYLSGFDWIVSYLPDRDGSLANNLRRGARKSCIVLPHRPAAGEHAADAWSRPLLPQGQNLQPALPRLHLPENLLDSGAAWLRGLCGGRPPAVIHPGSGGAAKNWPLANFRQLADWLQRVRGWQPVFLLGEAESNWPMAATTPWPTVKRPGLAQAAGMLSAARLYIGNDSGITHLAASLDTPVIALFGPTDPGTWGPRGPRVRVIRAPGPGHAMSDLSVAEARRCCQNLLDSDSRR